MIKEIWEELDESTFSMGFGDFDDDGSGSMMFLGSISQLEDIFKNVKGKL